MGLLTFSRNLVLSFIADGVTEKINSPEDQVQGGRPREVQKEVVDSQQCGEVEVPKEIVAPETLEPEQQFFVAETQNPGEVVTGNMSGEHDMHVPPPLGHVIHVVL